jgi:hypothetical protein
MIMAMAMQAATSAGVPTTDIIAWIVVPLVLFVLGAAGTGITLLIKGSAYMARSQVAQENTATTNQEISDQLAKYMERTDTKLNGLDVRVSVLEDARNDKVGYRRGSSPPSR